MLLWEVLALGFGLKTYPLSFYLNINIDFLLSFLTIYLDYASIDTNTFTISKVDSHHDNIEKDVTNMSRQQILQGWYGQKMWFLHNPEGNFL